MGTRAVGSWIGGINIFLMLRSRTGTYYLMFLRESTVGGPQAQTLTATPLSTIWALWGDGVGGGWAGVPGNPTYISLGDDAVPANFVGFRGLATLLPHFCQLSVPEVGVCGVYPESP